MWGVTRKARVFICLGATDMRKSSESLAVLITQELDGNPVTGDLFAFCNRGKNITKILYWDRNGFCLWKKKLESDRFKWPQSDTDLREIDQETLGWLLEGLDIGQAHQKINRPVVI